MHIASLWPWLFVIWTASEIALVITTHTRPSQGSTHDRGSILVLWATIIACISACDWLADTFPGAGLGGAALMKPLVVGLFVTGLVVRWIAILSLGRSFSVNVAIHTSQTIYQDGLYRSIRHPSYLGMLLIFLAIGLHSRNAVSLTLMLIGPAAALLYRIHVEENAMQQAFGAEYAIYRQLTKRIIPGIY